MSNHVRRQKKPKTIVKENILRVMLEEPSRSKDIGKVRELSKEFIILGSWQIDLDVYFMEVLDDLQVAGLLTINQNQVSITKDGLIEAANILSKHQAIEKFFMKDLDKNEAHIAAGILEHFISKEVLENMNRIRSLEENGIELVNFTSDEGIITALIIDDTQLFERMVSMGICPGERIKIIAKVAAGFIVKLKHTQIAIDNSLCNKILVAMI